MSENREIVLPGELLEERKGRKLGEGVYLDGEKVFSKVVGIPRATDVEIAVMPLFGKYLPRVGDRIIGIVSEVQLSGWIMDINSPYVAFLPLSEATEEFIDSRTDISRYFDKDDVVFCRISRVTKNKTIQASMRDFMARKLYGGTIIRVSPTKIPRIIGKAGSMIQLIKTKTKCEIYTGQNGLVWIRGVDKAKALEAILTVERESHTTGLTEKIEKMLGEEVG